LGQRGADLVWGVASVSFRLEVAKIESQFERSTRQDAEIAALQAQLAQVLARIT
jgi:hypothetical protein